MRILQVCNKPPYPANDGGTLAMFNLASALCKLGHKVTVLTMSTDKHTLTDEQYRQFSKIMPVFPVYVNTSISWTGFLKNLLFSRLPYTASRFVSAPFSNELIRLLKSCTFDVIQLEGSYLTLYIKAIRENCNSKIALRSHNIEYEIWERMAGNESNLLKRIYYRLLTKRIRRFEINSINLYDLLAPITERDLEKYSLMGNKRPAFVCQAGIDYTVDYPAEKIDAGFSLCYLGSLDWIPNQEGILWFVSVVFPLLLKRHGELKLHIAGRNAPQSLIKKLVHPNIVYHGEISDSRKYIAAYPVFVAPCFSGSGMRVKIIEAMSSGKAVITTSIGAEGIRAKHNRDILIANNPAEFLHCIDRLMNNPHLYNEIGRNASDFIAKHYNILNIATSLADFYNRNLK